MNTKHFTGKTMRCLICPLLVLFSFAAEAQQQENKEKGTITGKQADIRLVTKMGINASKADKSIALMLQPSIGLLFNEKLFTGVSAGFCINEGLLKNVSYQPVRDETFYWEVNSTGLSIDYIFNPFRAISPGISLNSGWGKAERNFIWNSLSRQSPEWSMLDKNLCKKGYFFYAEPAAFVNFNLTRAVSLKASLGYRFIDFTNATPAMQMSNKLFDGVSGGISVMFTNLFRASN